MQKAAEPCMASPGIHIVALNGMNNFVNGLELELAEEFEATVYELYPYGLNKPGLVKGLLRACS